MLAQLARTALKSAVPKATFVTPSAALAARRDILTDLAVSEIRSFKPVAVKVTDPVLTKKFTPPTPPPSAKVSEVSKEELEAYAKGQ